MPTTPNVTTPTKPVTVYVVEDYKLVRVGLLSVLRNDPRFKVLGESETAEDAITHILAMKPDVVLMDIGLPGMNGIEATARIREHAPDTRVVILTSHDDETEVLAAMSAGAHAYCLKDIPSEKMLDVVKTVHEGAIWLDPHIAQVALNLFSNNEPGKTNEDLKRTLTPREHQILTMIVEGKNNNEIAELIHVSVHTVKVQVSSILAKLTVNDRVQAAVKAVKEGIV